MRNFKSQSTLEYVILIGLVAAALAAMVPYLTRAFRSNIWELQENFSPEPIDE